MHLVWVTVACATRSCRPCLPLLTSLAPARRTAKCEAAQRDSGTVLGIDFFQGGLNPLINAPWRGASRYSEVGDPVEIMGSMLEWQHLVPTAPDTLVALPQADADPFLLSAAPAVLFAGNQAAYGTSLKQGTLSGNRVRNAIGYWVRNKNRLC